MAEDTPEDLDFRFDDNVQDAMQYCESLICKDRYKNIQHFSDTIKQKNMCHMCTFSWSKPTLVVQCKNC